MFSFTTLFNVIKECSVPCIANVTSYITSKSSSLSAHYSDIELDLSISEFCARYASILHQKWITKLERTARITHLKELMHLSTKFQRTSVLSFHAACLLKIERGNMTQDKSFRFECSDQCPLFVAAITQILQPMIFLFPICYVKLIIKTNVVF